MFQRPPRSKWEICYVSVKLALPILSLSFFFWRRSELGPLPRGSVASSRFVGVTGAAAVPYYVTEKPSRKGFVRVLKNRRFCPSKTIGFWWFLKNHRFNKACAEKPSRKGFVRVLKNHRFCPSKTIGFWWFLKNHRFLMVFEKPSV